MQKLQIEPIPEPVVGVTHPLLLCSYEAYDHQGGTPPLEFCHPIGQRALWCYDDVGARGIPHQTHVPQQGYGLERLAQTLQYNIRSPRPYSTTP